MTLNMRLEEPGVISVSSQVFTTQTNDATITLLLNIFPFKLKENLFPLLTYPYFSLN